MNSVRTLERGARRVAALPVACGVVAAAPFMAGSLAQGTIDAAQRHARAVIQSVASGQLPYWNPWSCGGAALWQHPMVSLITPAYPLSVLLPIRVAATISVALHFCAGVGGLYLLLRRVAQVGSAW